MLGSEESTTQIQDWMYQKWGQKGKERKKVHVGPSRPPWTHLLRQVPSTLNSLNEVGAKVGQEL